MAGEPEGGNVARIFVVDDNDLVRRALEIALTRMGHQVRSMASPIDALEAITGDPPDLAVLDFGMPVMNGATLLKEMRAQLRERCPKAVIISGAPQEDVREGTRGLGVDGYVSKPFHLAELRRAVDGALELPAEYDARPARRA